MRPSARSAFLLFLRVCVASLLCLSPALLAQTQDAPSSIDKPQTPAPVKKPVHKTRMLKSNDPVVHLGDRAPRPDGSSSAQPAAPEVNAASKDQSPIPDDPAQRKAEIAGLEKQIKEKRQRVELLMRLFVTDEKAFLLNPTNPNEDAATREQRRYEQDELHYEGAQIARLQARLDSLKSLPDH